MSTDEAAAILDIVAARQITRIVHFTTYNGLIGIFDSGEVLSRTQLDARERLAHVGRPVWSDRSRDLPWAGHVNLSISVVNRDLFQSSRRRHETADLWWLVLAFDPSVLTHPGVQFTTTNNTYPVVRRMPGAAGLEAMFASCVPFGYYGSTKTRATTTPAWQTTCLHAEVLYPGSLSLEHLREIIVPEPERVDAVAGLFAAFGRSLSVTVTCDPGVFK